MKPMKLLRLFPLACAALLAATPAHATVNLLLNGGFENGNGTAFANGTNPGVTVPGWALISGNTDIQQGSATGTGFALPNLAPFNGAYSGGSTATGATANQNTDTGGNHFFDGTNDVNGFTIITQTFTLTATTNLSGSYALGIRDTGGNQAGTVANFTAGNTSRIDIYAGTGTTGTNVLTSYGDTTATGAALSANPGWEINSFAANNLAAGTYTFRVELAGTQNIDAVNLVPEPSTWALTGLGVVGMGVLVMRRRHRAA